MKFAHNITVSVFCMPEDNEVEIRNTLISLFPFDLEKEKIAVNGQNATGFNERKIRIFDVKLKKDSHINSFMKELKQKLGEQCCRIEKDADTRIDDEFCFFIRLDKERLVRDKEYVLTDSGNCFHIRMSLAVFPKKRENALKLAREFFAQ